MPHQAAKPSTARPNQDRSKGPAPSLRAIPEQLHAQPWLAETHPGILAQSSRAQGSSALPQPKALPRQKQQSHARKDNHQQPQALQEDHPHVRSSPLYAASEGEDSESESSAGKHTECAQAQGSQDLKTKQAKVVRVGRAHTSTTSNAATDAPKPVAKQDQVGHEYLPQPARQTRASSGQASRAVKPPTGRAQGRAKPAAPGNPVGKQKGRKLAGPADADDLEGFGLLSEDEQQPARHAKAGSEKPEGTAQVQQRLLKLLPAQVSKNACLCPYL